MKKCLIALLTLFMTMGAFADEKVGPSVQFKEGNFFAITSEFNRRLLDNFAEKVLSYKEKELIIYFDTPGGSVIALSRMAQIMESSDITFTCVASFAASAGFMLFQHCNNRYLLADGVLMSHNWAGSFSGEGPRILTMYNTIQSIVDALEATAIKKMSVDKFEYARLINSNLWMTSKLATKYAAIDAVITNLSCSDKIINQRNATIEYTFSGVRFIYKSGCPLIQKTYYKVKGKSDVFIDAGVDLFKAAQKNYKFGNANWIYMGNKNQ